MGRFSITTTDESALEHRLITVQLSLDHILDKCYGSQSSGGDDLSASECESKTTLSSDLPGDAGKTAIKGLSLSV